LKFLKYYLYSWRCSFDR